MKQKLIDVGMNILLAFFMISFLVSGCLIGKKYLDKKNNDKILCELADRVKTEDLNSKTEISDLTKKDDWAAEIEKRRTRLEKYQELEKNNEDMIGWITIPDTKVDYPVMQTLEDPDFYLKHDFEKKKSSYGMIYMSADCDMENAVNYVIYGHHMKDGSMFADLDKYTDPQYAKAHEYIWFDTMKEVHVYQLVAVAKATGEEEKLYQKMFASDREELNEFLNEINARCLYGTKEEISSGKEFLTLMTCEYSLTNGRIIIIAKKLL